jgi:hypothetical protein
MLEINSVNLVTSDIDPEDGDREIHKKVVFDVTLTRLIAQ